VESLLHIEALPADVKERILARTQGNPFFVEEVVRALIDAGLVYHDGVAWRARDEIAEMAVPESVQSVILGRVDRLDRETRHVLQSAAVIGRLFRRRLLERVARQEGALDRALGELEDRTLIYAERVVPEEEYSFQHVLTQETVYQNILRRQRAVFHRQVAEGLEALYGESLEEYHEQLAYHYERAGVQDKALEYLERAGDKAQAQYANDMAEGFYRNLLERLGTLGRVQDVAGIWAKLGAVLTTVGRYDEALALTKQAADFHQAAGDPEQWGAALAQVGHLYGLKNRSEEGLAYLLPAVAQLEIGGVSRGLALAYAALAGLYWDTGRLDEGLAVAERAAAFARTTRDYKLLGVALERRASLLATLVGHHKEALRVFEEAQAAAERANDLETLSWTLSSPADLYIYRGEFDTAQRNYEAAQEVAKRAGNPLQVAMIPFRCGQIAFYQGHLDRAHQLQQVAVANLRQAGVEQGWEQAVGLLTGLLCLVEGRWEEARLVLEEGVQEAERSGSRLLQQLIAPLRAECDLLEGDAEAARTRLLPLLDPPGREEFYGNAVLPALAWAHLEMGEPASAEQVVAEAIRRMRADDDRLELVDALRVQALVAIQQGRWDAATQALEEGLELARGMPYPYAEGRLLHAYGQMHAEQVEPNQARKRLEEARAIFGRLGARKDAERVAQAMADLAPRA
jgi:tetratricopeptide (TPR) repeat protein